MDVFLSAVYDLLAPDYFVTYYHLLKLFFTKPNYICRKFTEFKIFRCIIPPWPIIVNNAHLSQKKRKRLKFNGPVLFLSNIVQTCFFALKSNHQAKIQEVQYAQPKGVK